MTNPVSRRCVRVVVITTLVGLVAACVPDTGGGVVDPPGAPSLTVTPLITGIHRPWDIAFTPDGTLLFTARTGTINASVGSMVRQLAAPGDVTPMGESGMMGLAVDADFASNRRIYTCFISNAGGATDIRVARWVVDAGYTTLGGRTDILTGIPVNTAGQTGRHGGCRVRTGPDGFLWVTTGDAVTGSVPQSPSGLGGKVLRITTNGAGAPGNPGGALRSEIYTLGHRNPQGVAFRPGDDRPFSVEHGTGCDDEVNALTAGANYGWNPGAGGGYNESAPMTDTVGVPGAVSAVWSSGCPTIAPSGATFVSGAQWGAWDGWLAVAVLKDAQLRFMHFDPASNAFLEQSIPVTDQGRLRVAVQGPDGDLYVAQDADPGSILRVHPTPAG